MEKNKKLQVVEQLKDVFSSMNIVIVSRNKGLTVLDANNLRKKIKVSKSSYQVAKNSLVRIAVQGTRFEKLTEMLSGPTSIAYSTDVVAAAKALDSFSKENDKIEIVGGVMDGSLLSPAQIKQLASLPSLDELRGKIIGLVQAPAQKLAAVIQAPASQLARVVDAYSKK